MPFRRSWLRRKPSLGFLMMTAIQDAKREVSGALRKNGYRLPTSQSEDPSARKIRSTVTAIVGLAIFGLIYACGQHDAAVERESERQYAAFQRQQSISHVRDDRIMRRRLSEMQQGINAAAGFPLVTHTAIYRYDGNRIEATFYVPSCHAYESAMRPVNISYDEGSTIAFGASDVTLARLGRRLGIYDNVWIGNSTVDILHFSASDGNVCDDVDQDFGLH